MITVTLNDMDLPIICGLTESELRERRRLSLDSMVNSAIETVEIEDGYSYSFKASPEVIGQLANLVEL